MSFENKAVLDQLQHTIGVATNDLLKEPDWQTNKGIVDVLEKNPSALPAIMKLLKVRLDHRKPHIRTLAFHLLINLIDSSERARSVRGFGNVDFLTFLINTLPKAIREPNKKHLFSGSMPEDVIELQYCDLVLATIRRWSSSYGSVTPSYIQAYQKLYSAGVRCPDISTLNIPSAHDDVFGTVAAASASHTNGNTMTASPGVVTNTKQATIILDIPSPDQTRYKDGKYAVQLCALLVDAINLYSVLPVTPPPGVQKPPSIPSTLQQAADMISKDQNIMSMYNNLINIYNTIETAKTRLTNPEQIHELTTIYTVVNSVLDYTRSILNKTAMPGSSIRTGQEHVLSSYNAQLNQQQAAYNKASGNTLVAVAPAQIDGITSRELRPANLGAPVQQRPSSSLVQGNKVRPAVHEDFANVATDVSFPSTTTTVPQSQSLQHMSQHHHHQQQHHQQQHHQQQHHQQQHHQQQQHYSSPSLPKSVSSSTLGYNQTRPPSTAGSSTGNTNTNNVGGGGGTMRLSSARPPSAHQSVSSSSPTPLSSPPQGTGTLRGRSSVASKTSSPSLPHSASSLSSTSTHSTASGIALQGEDPFIQQQQPLPQQQQQPQSGVNVDEFDISKLISSLETTPMTSSSTIQQRQQQQQQQQQQYQQQQHQPMQQQQQQQPVQYVQAQPVYVQAIPVQHAVPNRQSYSAQPTTYNPVPTQAPAPIFDPFDFGTN